MFPYNEYQTHEHRNDLLRSVEKARLARETQVKRLLFEQFGWLLLAWGAKFAAKNASACQIVKNRSGQIVTVCPA